MKILTSSMRAAIFGGTFDPIHIGHIAIIKYFTFILNLDLLIVVPTGQFGKKTHIISNSIHRLAMVRLALAELNKSIVRTRLIIASDEIKRYGLTYTIDTLIDWRKRLGSTASISLIIGADQLQNIKNWHNWWNLLEFAHLCVSARPGFTLYNHHYDFLKKKDIMFSYCQSTWIKYHTHGGIFIDNLLKVDISSTNIRSSIKILGVNNKNIYLPNTVWKYIQHNHLYY